MSMSVFFQRCLSRLLLLTFSVTSVGNSAEWPRVSAQTLPRSTISTVGLQALEPAIQLVIKPLILNPTSRRLDSTVAAMMTPETAQRLHVTEHLAALRHASTPHHFDEFAQALHEATESIAEEEMYFFTPVIRAAQRLLIGADLGDSPLSVKRLQTLLDPEIVASRIWWRQDHHEILNEQGEFIAKNAETYRYLQMTIMTHHDRLIERLLSSVASHLDSNLDVARETPEWLALADLASTAAWNAVYVAHRDMLDTFFARLIETRRVVLNARASTPTIKRRRKRILLDVNEDLTSKDSMKTLLLGTQGWRQWRDIFRQSISALLGVDLVGSERSPSLVIDPDAVEPPQLSIFPHLPLVSEWNGPRESEKERTNELFRITTVSLRNRLLRALAINAGEEESLASVLARARIGERERPRAVAEIESLLKDPSVPLFCDNSFYSDTRWKLLYLLSEQVDLSFTSDPHRLMNAVYGNGLSDLVTSNAKAFMIGRRQASDRLQNGLWEEAEELIQVLSTHSPQSVYRLRQWQERQGAIMFIRNSEELLRTLQWLESSGYPISHAADQWSIFQGSPAPITALVPFSYHDRKLYSLFKQQDHRAAFSLRAQAAAKSINLDWPATYQSILDSWGKAFGDKATSLGSSFRRQSQLYFGPAEFPETKSLPSLHNFLNGFLTFKNLSAHELFLFNRLQQPDTVNVYETSHIQFLNTASQTQLSALGKGWERILAFRPFVSWLDLFQKYASYHVPMEDALIVTWPRVRDLIGQVAERPKQTVLTEEHAEQIWEFVSHLGSEDLQQAFATLFWAQKSVGKQLLDSIGISISLRSWFLRAHVVGKPAARLERTLMAWMIHMQYLRRGPHLSMDDIERSVLEILHDGIARDFSELAVTFVALVDGKILKAVLDQLIEKNKVTKHFDSKQKAYFYDSPSREAALRHRRDATLITAIVNALQDPQTFLSWQDVFLSIGDPSVPEHELKALLKKMVTNGRLLHTNGYYRLPSTGVTGHEDRSA